MNFTSVSTSLWILFLVSIIVLNLIKDRDWILAYRNIEWRLYIYIIPTIVLIILTLSFLQSYNDKLFGFSIRRLFSSLIGSYASGGNVIATGTLIPVVGVILILLIMTQLPRWALIEEEIFRKGTKNWLDGLWRSLLFGLTHILVGVSLATALSLSIAGLLFTHFYFQGGVKKAAKVHFQYNLFLLSAMLVVSLITTVKFFI